MKTDTLFHSTISSLPLLARGKVRDIYAIDEAHLLIVTTDRLSAFDVVLPDPIPGKGQVLNAITVFWLQKFSHIIKNQLTGIDPESVVAEHERQQVRGRSLVVKRLKPLPIEAVVRGYLIGSGWKDYQQTGAVCGIRLAAGLSLAAALPSPIFTPATKADIGDHDINISFAEACGNTSAALSGLLWGTGKNGAQLVAEVRSVACALYREAAAYALARGVIIADTKFEFGVDAGGELYLIDEVLTPDSSRFWPVDGYALGVSPPSYDKQYVRDYLDTLDWNKTAPGPHLPAEVISRTAAKYREALNRLCFFN